MLSYLWIELPYWVWEFEMSFISCRCFAYYIIEIFISLMLSRFSLYRLLPASHTDTFMEFQPPWVLLALHLALAAPTITSLIYFPPSFVFLTSFTSPLLLPFLPTPPWIFSITRCFHIAPHFHYFSLIAFSLFLFSSLFRYYYWDISLFLFLHLSLGFLFIVVLLVSDAYDTLFLLCCFISMLFMFSFTLY